MEISVHADGATCHVALGGGLDIYAAAQLRDALHDLLAHHSTVEIDLASVDDIDSAGLQVLMSAKSTAAALGHRLSMRAHSPVVLDLLDLCKLERFFGDPVIELGARTAQPSV